MNQETEVLVQLAKISPGRPSLTRHPRFFPLLSLLLIVFVFLGFAPTYYMRPADADAIPAYLHIHGAAMTAWYVLLLLQTTLMVAGPALGRLSLNVAGTPFPGLISLMVLPLLIVVHDRILT